MSMFFRSKLPSISVSELQSKIEADEAPVLLDIRSAPERAAGSLGGVHIEMQSLPGRLQELSDHREAEIVVYCRTGNRSAAVVKFLKANGFEGAVNLTGGLMAWARQTR
jgi:rhodanese-related sulfurtransferase